jgi:hypothetical protein
MYSGKYCAVFTSYIVHGSASVHPFVIVNLLNVCMLMYEKELYCHISLLFRMNLIAIIYMQLLTGFLKVTTVFIDTFQCHFVLFLGCPRFRFGGGSVQQSVPTVDLTSDRGQESPFYLQSLLSGV